MRGRLYSWLESYLKDRQLPAAVNGHLSTAYPVGSGVPQGSILGPTLFLLYVNDAEDTLPRGADLAVYADNTTLYKCVSTKGDVDTDAETLQVAVSALAEWGNTWHIKFEPVKLQALTISHPRSPIEVPAITFQGTVVPEVAELRLLGIMFDKDLSFRTHIRQLNIRGTQRLGFLRKAAAVLGPAGCVTAYKGFVRPVLEYGMLTWMGASRTTLRQLANVQRAPYMSLAGVRSCQAWRYAEPLLLFAFCISYTIPAWTSYPNSASSPTCSPSPTRDEDAICCPPQLLVDTFPIPP